MTSAVTGDVAAHNTFHGACITVIGWHGLGRGLGQIRTSLPALLWLAGAVMCDLGVRNIFHGVSIGVVG